MPQFRACVLLAGCLAFNLPFFPQVSCEIASTDISLEIRGYIRFKSYLLDKVSTTFPAWMYVDANVPHRTHWIHVEKGFDTDCNNGSWPRHQVSLIYYNGTYNLPTRCDNVVVCNATYCAYYGTDLHPFSVEVPKTDVMFAARNVTIVNPVLSHFTRFTKYFRTSTFFPSSEQPPIRNYKKLKTGVPFNETFVEDVDNRLLVFSSEKCLNKTELLIEVDATLPTLCDDVMWCSKNNCIILMRVAGALGFVYRRATVPQDSVLWLPPYCNHTTPLRNERSVTTNNEDSVFRFNLPGYYFCGPGTQIEKMDDVGGPTNELDNICRQHDVDYKIGVHPREADKKLLQGVWRTAPGYYPLFLAVFEAKTYFEVYFGYKYTSHLYYFGELNPSLTYTMSDISVYDGMPESAAVTNGKFLESNWKQKLQEIWLGYCNKLAFPHMNSLGNNDPKDTVTVSPGSADEPAQPQAGTSSDETAEEQLQDGDYRIWLDADGYPLVPDKYNCRLVINEVSTKNGVNPSYVELHRLCREKEEEDKQQTDPTTQKKQRHKPPATSMHNYHLLVIRVGDPSTIYMSISLHHHTMRLVDENYLATKRRRTQAYFTIGTESTNPDLLFSQIRNIITPADGIRGIPAEDDATFAIVLLHFPIREEHKKYMEYFNLKKLGSVLTELPINDDITYVIETYYQDILLFGSPCKINDCEEFLRFFRETSIVTPTQGIYFPPPYPTKKTEAPFLSLNRCSDTRFPMQINDFPEAEQTPNAGNICENLVPLRFNLRGTPIQSTAQRIIANLHAYFLKHSSLFPKDATRMTAEAVSLSVSTIKRILSNVETGDISTPGKKRNRPSPVMDRIDSFNTELIKNIIKQFYANNVAPFVEPIYRAFLNQAVIPADEDGPERPFKCSEKTFRKILRRIGFTYGKINVRDAVLMRPEIVLWRAKYLEAKRQWETASDPWEVVYLDETWIDPHARTGKAWIPYRMTNYRQRSEYSFKRHKVSRGGRIIILNAGTKDGFVEGAMKVYAVSKSKATSEDYHDNVNAKTFMEWFKQLLASLKKTGKKYVIVIDNAPYHGMADVPKSSSTKQFMYDWLVDNVPYKDRPALLPIHVYKKPELWTIVKEYKEKHNYFLIDALAEKEGHRVLRLPPYNCDLNPIELVWAEVKDRVRKENHDQNIQTVIRIAKDVMGKYPPEHWKKCVEHVKKLEEQYREQDGVYESWMDKNHQQVVIPVDQDDDENDYIALPVDPNIFPGAVHDLPVEADDDDELLDV